MRAWSTVLLLLTACGFPRPPDLPAAGDDASVPPADASLCFGSFVRVCFDSAADLPTQPQHFGDDGINVVINTNIALVCDQHNNQKAAYCVVTGAGLTFAQTTTLRAIGTKPLVLLSTALIDVRGVIDVSFGGAGADPAGQCTGATPAMGNSGGAGGSFGGRGGNGGQVNAPAGSSTAAPRLARFPATLRGGCDGEYGAPSGSGGPPGFGGGAVAFIAPSIALKGVINASGGYALGGIADAGQVGAGGGGGGSGGMIVLDIPMAGIMVGPSGLLFSNGGGGGEGADMTLGGRPGRTPSAPTPAAEGGGDGGPGNIGNPDGGNGGAGSAGAEIDGEASPGGAQGGDGGGGGGGGGAGFIHAPGIAGDSVISPPSLDLP